MSMCQFLPKVVKQPIFLLFQKFPKNSHKLFGSYLHQICQKLSFPSSKITQQCSFSYSVQSSTLWRKSMCQFLPKVVKQPIFLLFQKFPKNSHKLFGSYLHQICQKLSFPSSKITQQCSFSYSVQSSTLWRKCYLYILDFLKNLRRHSS